MTDSPKSHREDTDPTPGETSAGGESTSAAGHGADGGNPGGGPSVPPVEGTEAGVGGAGVGLGDLTGGGVRDPGTAAPDGPERPTDPREAGGKTRP